MTKPLVEFRTPPPYMAERLPGYMAVSLRIKPPTSSPSDFEVLHVGGYPIGDETAEDVKRRIVNELVEGLRGELLRQVSNG